MQYKHQKQKQKQDIFTFLHFQPPHTTGRLGKNIKKGFLEREGLKNQTF